MGKVDIDEAYIEINEQYKRGCTLSEYNETYSIASANESKDGKKYLEWCYPKQAEGPGEKMIPNQVRLGDIDQAKKILRHYLNLLEGGEAGENPNVPF